MDWKKIPEEAEVSELAYALTDNADFFLGAVYYCGIADISHASVND